MVLLAAWRRSANHTRPFSSSLEPHISFLISCCFCVHRFYGRFFSPALFEFEWNWKLQFHDKQKECSQAVFSLVCVTFKCCRTQTHSLFFYVYHLFSAFFRFLIAACELNGPIAMVKSQPKRNYKRKKRNKIAIIQRLCAKKEVMAQLQCE